MLQKANRVNALCGTASGVDNLTKTPSLEPFNQSVCDFLSAVSERLMADPEAKLYSDVVSFAFFCRRGKVNQLKRLHTNPQEVRLGRGLVFHIAPGNVAVNFAFSLVAALLAGNVSIVKISEKAFPQTEIITKAFRSVLKADFPALIPYINIWAYPKQCEDVTADLSALCDVRIIWGGDETIRTIRKFPISARAFDVTFADRVSICLMNAQAVATLTNLDALIRNFYNDTFVSDQNACTAPFLIIWEGTPRATTKAQGVFWPALERYVQSNYELSASIAIDKLEAACKAAIAFGQNLHITKKSNYIVRLRLEKLEQQIVDFKCAGGLFYEYCTLDRACLSDFITPRFQTMSYFGYDPKALGNWVKAEKPHGIDRIVPLGQAMDFDILWDGYDLIRTLSRSITVW